METKTKKNRGWVKTAIIIFLAVMLLLTLLSNTIMNWSLPQVKGQYAGYGQISTAVRGTGNVMANMAYSVQIDSVRQIKSVNVRNGDVVVAGQELFTLEEEEDTEGSELNTALQELEDMKYNYDVKVVGNMPQSFVDAYTSLNRLKEDLAKMQSDFSKAGQYETDLKIAEANTEKAQSVVDNITEQIAELEEKKGEIESGEAADNRILANLIASRKAAQEDIKNAEKAVETCQKAYDAALSDMPQSVKDAQSIVDAEQKTFDSLELTLRYSLEDYFRAENTNITALDNLNAYQDFLDYFENPQKDAGGNPIPGWKPLDAKIDKTIEVMDDEIALFTKSDSITEEQLSDLRSIRSDLLAVKEQYEALDSATADLAESERLNVYLSAAESSLDNAKAQLDNAQRNLESIQDRIDLETDNATSALRQSIKDLEQSLKTANSQLKEAQKKEQAAAEKVDGSVTEETIKAQKRAIEDAQNSLAEMQKEAGNQNELFNMELERDRKAIEDKEAQIEKLRGAGSGSVVTARYGGTITTVNVIAGDTVNPGDTLCGIDVEEKGYTMTIPVTAEQARQIHVGDKASVSDYWWGTPDIVVSAIKTDKESQNGGKLVEFTVNGDVSEGQTLTVSVGERQTSYDVVVPNSAIKEDADGTFILVATVKSSPLGNRYIATRVPVTVVAKDNFNSAIDTGSEYGYDYVITTTTKPVEAGSLVRLVDEVE